MRTSSVAVEVIRVQVGESVQGREGLRRHPACQYQADTGDQRGQEE